jgi:hypothetical protein
MLENQDIKVSTWVTGVENITPSTGGTLIVSTTDAGHLMWDCLSPNATLDTASGMWNTGTNVKFGLDTACPGGKEIPQSNPVKGLRFNEGKLRYDLIHPEAQKGLVKVLTLGAQKYAERNWEKGMEWSKITASLKRHIAAIEAGEDFDKESGLLHADHVQANAHFLSAYYKIAPQYDDRPHTWLDKKRVALDIDEVLCDFTAGWAEQFHDVDSRPTAWYYDRNMLDRFNQMREAGALDAFYLGLRPKMNPKELPFEPVCYITSRPVSTEITEQWLDMHGFPRVKVVTVPHGKSKVEALQENNIDIFVDDSFDNFREANAAGICTFLWSAPHNERFDVGFKRIKSLKDLV